MLKKILICLPMVAALAACTDDYTDWAAPQQTAQPSAVGFGDGSVQPAGLIDFAEIGTEQNVKVCSITPPTSTDTAYADCSYILNLESASMPVAADGTVAAADLKAYIEANYGKAPAEREMPATVDLWISDGKTAVKTASSGQFMVRAKLVAPYISEGGYWLIGDPSEWNPMCVTMPFSHSGQNVYDDPVFTVMFHVAAGDTYFAIADDKTHESGEWPDVLGCAEGDGKNGTEGKIARRTELSDDGSWKVTTEAGGYVRFTINMMDYAYKIEILDFSDGIYEVGNESGWAESHYLYGPNFDGKYQGFYYLDGEFKFKPNFDNWDGDWEYDGDGKIADNSSGLNIPAPDPAGFYKIDVDLSTMTYTLTQVTSISMIGDFNDWGGDVDMTYNNAEKCWEVTTTLGKEGGLKLRMNHDWTTSWGGNGSGDNFDDLTQNNGANLNLPAGTYNFKFYLSYEGNNRLVCTPQ